MNSSERRKHIIKILEEAAQPVSASAIAAQVGVSRQVIVNDIALLRASGFEVAATPRGYILQENETLGGILRTIACKHGCTGLAEELYIVVDHGGGLIDVTVEHPVYGQISGQLHIFSRYDADNFLMKLDKSKAFPLCNLTDGVHLHTLCCRSQEDFERIMTHLKEKDILFDADST